MVLAVDAEVGFGEILRDVAALLGATLVVATVLARYRIPSFLGPLLVGMAAAYIPLGDRPVLPETARLSRAAPVNHTRWSGLV